MIPRGKLYISYRDLIKGMYYCLSDRFRSENVPVFRENKEDLICLSVRTGFDLVLTALNFPRGSEMLVTEINIPDMFKIADEHGINLVPLAVSKHNLNISLAQLEAAITPATKAVLITHLFGGIMETDEIVAVANKHNLLVFEDCAQAYAGNLYKGNPESDVVMFSFGLIKTNTAIKGTLLKIKNARLYDEVSVLNGKYPEQKTSDYFKKLIKVAFVKFLTTKMIYTLLYKIVKAKGRDFDEVLGGFTRGFPGDNIFSQIRHRPCTANKRLLHYKLKNFNQEAINSRMKLAADILHNIPDSYKIGFRNNLHTYWVIPVETNHPDRLIQYLRKNGFDASQKASSLVRIANRTEVDINEELLLENLVYLPVDPGMSKEDRFKISQLLTNFN
ncbi:MAG: aminotransferase class V-fold PLP-dependent enzyme [Bacteroidota bacterium]